MENNSLKTQIEQLSQQVEDLQLQVSNTNAIKKKYVYFLDDSVSPVQRLRDALPSMFASDLAELGRRVLRELAKRVLFNHTSSTASSEDTHPPPQTTGNVHMTDPAGPSSPPPPKTPSPIDDNDQPGTKTRTPGYMKGTAAADARSRSRPDSAADDLTKRPDTRTSARPTTPKTAGRPAPGTRDKVGTGDRRKWGHTVAGDSPPSPSAVALATPKKGRVEPETEGQGTAVRRARKAATGTPGSIRRRGTAGRR